MTTEQGRKDAEQLFDDSQEEIKKMEEKRLQVEKEAIEAKKTFEANPNDTNLKQINDAKTKAHTDMMNDYHTRHRDLSEIREAMGELLHGRKPRIRI